jgi:hypothetical protein
VLCRALEEMQRACQAADSASREAEASSTASAAALQEQLLRVRQLQAQLDAVSMQHSMEMRAAQQSMREQVRCWVSRTLTTAAAADVKAIGCLPGRCCVSACCWEACSHMHFGQL